MAPPENRDNVEGGGMRKVKKWRYYCEFCEKSGASGGHMAKHETHCTKNPNRKCGMCAFVEEIQRTPEEIREFISKFPLNTKIQGDWLQHAKHLVPVKSLMDFVNSCPACAVAALRQNPDLIEVEPTFDFMAEKDNFWNIVNNEKAKRDCNWGRY